MACIPRWADLSAKLDKATARSDRINSEHTIEVEQLSWHVVRISDVLVDLGMLLIQNILQLLKSAQEVLPVVDLVLQCLQEALASSAGPWD
jgi:Flp pilus assembly CpaE family ATPase